MLMMKCWSKAERSVGVNAPKAYCVLLSVVSTVHRAVNRIKVEAFEYVQADVQRSFIPPKKSKTLVCMRLCCFHQGIGT